MKQTSMHTHLVVHLDPTETISLFLKSVLLQVKFHGSSVSENFEGQFSMVQAVRYSNHHKIADFPRFSSCRHCILRGTRSLQGSSRHKLRSFQAIGRSEASGCSDTGWWFGTIIILAKLLGIKHWWEPFSAITLALFFPYLGNNHTN